MRDRGLSRRSSLFVGVSKCNASKLSLRVCGLLWSMLRVLDHITPHPALQRLGIGLVKHFFALLTLPIENVCQRILVYRGESVNMFLSIRRHDRRMHVTSTILFSSASFTFLVLKTSLVLIATGSCPLDRSTERTAHVHCISSHNS